MGGWGGPGRATSLRAMGSRGASLAQLPGRILGVYKEISTGTLLVDYLAWNTDRCGKGCVLHPTEEERGSHAAAMCGVRDRGSISVRLLESLAGKCMSLQLAVGEVVKVFTRAFFDVLIRIRRGEIGTKKQTISLRG